MSADVLPDPYSPFESSAPVDARLAEGTAALKRQNTPHLTLDEYRNWQYSPVLAASPELERRRVRRKPSIQNLTDRSAQSAFSWAPSSTRPPSFQSHSFGPLDLQSQQPSTPRPRAYTASPSLSSTITTLQSTPTHTPIFRAGSFDEQRRRLEQVEVKGPIATKRKYPSVKHARRFPRQQRQQAYREDSGDSAVYEVYAAVFDTSGEAGDLKEERKQIEPNPDSQAAPTNKKERSVRFATVHSERDHSASSTPSSERSVHRRDQTATSSFSLSKFEFPAPPGTDNWAGSFDHLPKSPSATVLYRGASFDLINPHASLLLGNHKVETPAEIDGLLDDYFEEREETVLMASNPDTGEMSQQSLRSVSDSTKQTRTLYDDADTARRNILRVATPITVPPKVAVKESPAPAVTMPTFVREQASGASTGFVPIKRSISKSFQNIGRALGVTAGDSNKDLAEEGRATKYAESQKSATTAAKYDAQRHDIGKNDDRVSGFSDPFDLSVSDIRNNAELMSVNGVLKQERSVLLASASDSSGQRNALTVEDASNVHAVSETERELGSIYNGYDYTRETLPTAQRDPTLSSASIERGLRYDNGPFEEEDDYDWAAPVSPGAVVRSSYHGFRIAEESELMRPLPLASRRNGMMHQHNMPSIHRRMRLSGTSDVPTSEQTYGETNQLLLITPNTNVTEGRCNPLTCTRHTHIHKDDSSPKSTPGRYEHDDKENTPPGLDGHGAARSFFRSSPEPGASLRPGSMVMSPSIVLVDRNSHPSQFRTSSIYPESDWETQRGESPGLTESEDEDDNGDRFSDYSPSADSEHTRNDRRRLASTPFPRMNNPDVETSPLRARVKARDAGTGHPLTYGPTRGNCDDFESGTDDDESDIKDQKPRHFKYVPAKSSSFHVPEAQKAGPAIDFDSKPTGDAKRAMKIIDGKAKADRIGVHRFCSPGDRSSRQFSALRELESIRMSNPAAVKEASERILNRSHPNIPQTSSPTPVAKLQKLQSPFARQDNYKSRSFQKVAAIGRHDIAHGSFSSQKRLLPSPGAQSPRTPDDSSLAYSGSEGTFVTIRKKDSAQSHDQGWYPNDPSPTARALGLPPSTGHTAKVPSKLRSTSGRTSKQMRTAIDGQVELHEFKLVAVTGRSPGRALTDAELAEREPAWTNFPDGNNAVRKQAELLPHKHYKEQEAISLKYQNLSALIPFSALAFGLGGFDWIIARKTKGRITKMGAKQKRYALVVYFPLQLLAYAILLLVIGIIVYMRVHNTDGNSHGAAVDSSPLSTTNN